jgi:hypothetical protein
VRWYVSTPDNISYEYAILLLVGLRTVFEQLKSINRGRKNMEHPTEEVPVRTGIPREQRRARRQGVGREIQHLEEVATLVQTVGFNPYPDLGETKFVS